MLAIRVFYFSYDRLTVCTIAFNECQVLQENGVRNDQKRNAEKVTVVGRKEILYVKRRSCG